MFPYYIVPVVLRKPFLKLGKKLGVSQQSRGVGGYYNFLIKADYDPKKIEQIPVEFNGTSARMPLVEKRENYIKRHLHEPKTKEVNINGGKMEILTNSSLADIFWANPPLNLSYTKLDKILSDTILFYNLNK
jgi:hypothetical protein